MVENTDIIRNNFDNILKDFEKIGIYNYNKEDLDKITENMFIFSYIIIQILTIDKIQGKFCLGTVEFLIVSMV